MSSASQTGRNQTRRIDQAQGAPTDLLQRQQPGSVEMERALLGSILLDPRVADTVMMILRSGDFYDAAHGHLYHHDLPGHLFHRGHRDFGASSGMVRRRVLQL